MFEMWRGDPPDASVIPTSAPRSRGQVDVRLDAVTERWSLQYAYLAGDGTPLHVVTPGEVRTFPKSHPFACVGVWVQGVHTPPHGCGSPTLHFAES